ncbi:penicillin-binding protein 1A [Aestuariispira insulae]|uniref:Penicillin-binding protein 1A n=1 Tax=Aestuariispira insulae TaxID=1461337 RepID=A0A3D9HW66_9PROT|nr:penicillin-binding protein 1A [Aestuariispira insulae]RED53659.1 penicillin-binding protein 1A [Aestuariispira insulae]
MRFLLKFFIFLFSMAVLAGIVGVGGGLYALWYYGKGLPDYKQLADYQPPTATRIHAGDGQLIKEYAREQRVFVPIQSIPKEIIHGFVAAEDQNFFWHYGVDPLALARAVATNVVYYFENRRFIGASTITQQVAKNFLLTNEVSITRKAKEAILAFRIERALSKDRILELYLNEIYLGYGSFGVAAAALNYFDKSLSELTTAEIAYLAALPKAPNNYHPIRRTREAIERRNWVISRMEEEGYITKLSAARARAEDLVVQPRSDIQPVDAKYFVEEVRRELADHYGERGVTEGGLSVRTTLDPALQSLAQKSLRQGLEDYDRRHGYRGPVTQLDMTGNWAGALKEVKLPDGVRGWDLAVVNGYEGKTTNITLADGRIGTIPFAEIRWARKALEDQRVGGTVKKPGDVYQPGDVVLVETVTEGPPPKKGEPPVLYPENSYALRQIPEVDGALVALDPHTGRVYAMAGGWSYERSEFNRATQAKRQPGSAFKPFVYLAALDKGYTPATMILDAPFVLDQGPGLPKWKPANFSKKFYGPSPMRVGIEKSRNLMTVRLAQAIGMDTVADYAERFHIAEDMPEQLSMALGAASVSLIDMTAAYGMLVNGGKEITPTVIDRVQDRLGRTIYKHDPRDCTNCTVLHWEGQDVPRIRDNRSQLTDPASAYQVVTMLEGVVQRGTGRRIREVGKPLGGKTGTTNDSRDTWFVGFSPDLAVGVFIGFDTPIPLGRNPWGGQETGSSVAAPVFKAFMQEALADKPAIPFRTPEGIRMVRIDAETGKLATSGSQRIISEAFKPGTEPGIGSQAVFIDGSDEDEDSETAPMRAKSGTQRGVY